MRWVFGEAYGIGVCGVYALLSNTKTQRIKKKKHVFFVFLGVFFTLVFVESNGFMSFLNLCINMKFLK